MCCRVDASEASHSVRRVPTVGRFPSASYGLPYTQSEAHSRLARPVPAYAGPPLPSAPSGRRRGAWRQRAPMNCKARPRGLGGRLLGLCRRRTDTEFLDECSTTGAGPSHSAGVQQGTRRLLRVLRSMGPRHLSLPRIPTGLPCIAEPCSRGILYRCGTRAKRLREECRGRTVYCAKAILSDKVLVPCHSFTRRAGGLEVSGQAEPSLDA
jgi:hypothetical protein